jgi:hypothetical protein
MVSHIDKLIQPNGAAQSSTDRRALSAPIDQGSDEYLRPLPSISERKEASKKGQDYWRNSELPSTRIASAPESHPTSRATYDHRNVNPRYKDTIRVVNPSSGRSPVKAPKPLIVRKKVSVTGPTSTYSEAMMYGALESGPKQETSHRHVDEGLHQRYINDGGNGFELESIEEDRLDEKYTDSNPGTIAKKRASWFKRNSKDGAAGSRMSVEGSVTQSHASSNESRQIREAPPPPTSKTKNTLSSRLGQLFKKRTSRIKEDEAPGTSQYPSILQRASYLTFFAAHDVYNDHASVQDSVTLASRPQELRDRQIEPQQSWIAKLFHVKPVSKFICFQVSKRRARQEITSILKDWRRYGIHDVQVDKERNIVFGRVAAKNCKYSSTGHPQHILMTIRLGDEGSCICGRGNDRY